MPRGNGGGEAHFRTHVLLLVDVVRFSERRPADQVKMVRHLLAFLQDAPELAELPPGALYVNSTGDGFVLAIAEDSRAGVLLDVCSLAQRIVSQAGGFQDQHGVAMQVRGGLHVGPIATGLDGDRQQGFAVGHGLNWVARVAAAAAPGQVLVSGLFAEAAWDTASDNAAAERFYPGQDLPPFSLVVKHGRAAEVRVLVGEGLSEEVPPQLRELERIGQHLQAALEIVGESLLAGLGNDDETTLDAARRLCPRLTLWVPQDGKLKAIAPRVAFPLSAEAPTPTLTTWPLPPTSSTGVPRPSGPVAQAFHTRAAVALLDLPDYQRDPAKYVRRWEEAGAPAAAVHAFSRKSRAVLALPLVLLDEPAGVLCIDLMEPLRGKAGLVAAVFRTLQLRSSYLLAALLHLRRP